MDGHAPLTQLLTEWSSGRREAADEIVPLLYRELRKVAAARLRMNGADHTLQPTALVNEAYLKLAGTATPRWQNRTHFLAFASHIMRQILTDYSRREKAAKRGGGQVVVPLEEGLDGVERDSSLLALDDALTALEKVDARKARIIELKYFGGLTGEEISEAMEISTATVTRDLRLAEAWLRRFLAGE
ncbi:MAG TPA: sigma-70 family RNA polymerase sigma factor [Bryobacteraceae bacterium]|nr:sigma-70 family RNA polymerase sigma factor [Bryobacteraceae bacterium]